MRVAVTARDASRLADVASGLRNDPVALVADLSHPDAPGRLATDSLDALGHLDVLVNNAAMTARLATVETDAALVDRLYAVNVRAPLLLVAACIPSMTGRGGGSIVNVSSGSAVVGTPNRAAYAATKGAVDAMTRSLAVELGPAGIRVNSVAPGVIDTQLWARNKAVPGVIERIEAQTPLRRWGVPDDVSGVVAFLASDAARFVTGETICVDGGLVHTLDLYGGPV